MRRWIARPVRRYVAAAEELGVVRDGGDVQLTDEVIGMVVEAVRPHRCDGHGEAWRLVAAHDCRLVVRTRGWSGLSWDIASSGS
jgi:hypothetical protein